MPPRFAYWTIIAGGLPTAFRATEQEELMPTFQRLREKHPDAEMKWFARGKLWESPEAARANTDRTRGAVRQPAAPGEDSTTRAASPGGQSRGKSWRPGGEHRDPRQVFKDAKKDRNIRHRAEKFARKSGGDGDRPARAKPFAETRPASADWKNRPPREDASQARPPRQDWRDRPREGNSTSRPPRDDWRSRPRESAATDRPAQGDWKNRPPRSDDRKNRPAHQGAWKDRPGQGDWKSRPPRQDGKSNRPSHDDGWNDRPRQAAWKDRPPRERPHGDPIARGDSGSSFRDRPKGASFDKRAAAPFRRDENRGGYKGGSAAAPRGARPQGAPDWRADAPKPGWRDRAPKPDWRDRAPKPEWRDRPPREGSWRDRPPREKPHGDPMRDERSRPSAKPFADGKGADRDRAPRSEWRDRPSRDAWKDRQREGAPSHPPRQESWKNRGPRDKPHGDPLGDRSTRPGQRPYEPKRFDRNQATEERKPAAPRPAPDREPRRGDNPKPSAPPRPHDPQVLPPGPPERGRLVKKKRP
jgi:hypothetical protein